MPVVAFILDVPSGDRAGDEAAPQSALSCVEVSSWEVSVYLIRQLRTHLLIPISGAVTDRSVLPSPTGLTPGAVISEVMSPVADHMSCWGSGRSIQEWNGSRC